MSDPYKDPYRILGVSRDATDEEIKKAYREMVKKYHPDNYANSPMESLAEEKMKEINEAYDRIKQNRSAGAPEETMGYGGNFDARKTYDRIRRLINQNDIQAADNLLEIFSISDRGAEWNFLKGCVMLRRGNFYDAQKYFETACYQDPQNSEYRAALNNIRSSHARQEEREAGDKQNGDGALGCCESLLCCNCCCNCLGGNMFHCC